MFSFDLIRKQSSHPPTAPRRHGTQAIVHFVRNSWQY